jgi:hypothetical protein
MMYAASPPDQKCQNRFLNVLRLHEKRIRNNRSGTLITTQIRENNNKNKNNRREVGGGTETSK